MKRLTLLRQLEGKVDLRIQEEISKESSLSEERQSSLTAKGASVQIRMPYGENRDFNDVLLEEGSGAVQDCFKQANLKKTAQQEIAFPRTESPELRQDAHFPLSEEILDSKIFGDIEEGEKDQGQDFEIEIGMGGK